MTCPSAPHSGTVLIIVAGITAILLSLSAALVVMTRSEGREGELIAQDAQARMMLAAGLTFIQESSRLGWGVETYGWVDLRNGTDGPRGPRDLGTGRIPAAVWGGGTPDDSENDPSLAKGAAYNPTPASTPFDPPPSASTSATWPAPGSIYRADMYGMQRPPHALRLTRAYNPIAVDPAWVDEWERAYDGSDPASAASTVIGGVITPSDLEMAKIRADYLKDGLYSGTWWSTRYDLMRNTWSNLITKPATDLAPGYYGLMNPQPQADTLSDYLNGDTRPLVETTGRSWFRVYRERPGDHDGDGNPWYDRVPLSGNACFIVTCGAGGSKGFRDWNEVVAEGATALFGGDRSLFEELRATERILHFRAEWTGFSGGGYDTYSHYNTGNRSGDSISGLLTLTGGLKSPNWGPNGGHIGGSQNQLDTTNTSVNFCGSFKWIQRLEQAPPVW